MEVLDWVSSLMNAKVKLNSELAKALEEFESGYMAARNLAPRSRVDYRTDALQFLEYLGESGLKDLGQVGPNHINGYLAEMDRANFAGVTRRRKFIVVRALFKWLTAAGVVANNPALYVQPPLSEQKEARYLKKDDYRALLSVIQKPRDRAIVQTLLQTGIRLSELQHLSVDDLDLPEKIYKSRPDYSLGVARIRGKGRKERTVLINYLAAEALSEWLKVRPELETDALFVSNRGGPMSSRQIQRVVHKYLDLAGIKGASVHSLRHTFASQHLESGTDLRTISEFLGHSSLDITGKQYAHIRKRRQEIQITQHALK